MSPQGTLKVLEHVPSGTPPWALFNIGNHQPVALPDYIAALEAALGQKGVDRACTDATGRRAGERTPTPSASRRRPVFPVDPAAGRPC
jgi:hypothetical protein